MNTQFNNVTHPLTLKETTPMNAVRPIPQVTIDISGNRPHIGKTLIAGVVARTLADFGFTNVLVNNAEADLDIVSRGILERKVSQATLDYAVVINDMNSRPTPSMSNLTPLSPFLYDPYTGLPRAASDIIQDPCGLLMIPPSTLSLKVVAAPVVADDTSL